MSFLSPITAAVAAAIVIPALIALYFLKLRRRRLDVSTTLLWKKAIQDMQVNSPFQKLRRNLLLLLQLLLLIALLLAMARPTTRTVASPGRRVVIVIDHSASMNAADAGGGRTRLAAAKQTAMELVDQFNAGAGGGQGASHDDRGKGVMVVTFAQQARVAQPFTADLPRLKQRIREIEPTDQRSRLGPALDLIEPYAQQAAADKNAGLVVYVISDGRIEHDPAHPLSLAGAQLRYIRTGGHADPRGEGNVGIVSFSARRDMDKPGDVTVFARLANFGSSPVTTNVTLRVNGNVRRVRSVAIPAAVMGAAAGLPASVEVPVRAAPADKSAAHQGNKPSTQDRLPGEKSLEFSFTLSGGAMVEVSQDHHDVLAADDAAWLMLAPARRLRVLLVGKGNAFLERVIRSVGVRDLVRMDPKVYEQQSPRDLRGGGAKPQAAGAGSQGAGAPTDAAGYDVIVLDDYSPKHVPPVSSLSFDCAPPIPGLKVVRADKPASASKTVQAESGDGGAGVHPTGPQVILDWKRDNPIMRYVALDDVLVNDPGRLVVPSDATVLATGQSGPIIAQAPADGHTHVVVSFDVLQSNWPLYVSFPVFMSNAIQTLGLGTMADDAGLSYTTGQAAAVPAEADQATLSYTGPVELKAAVSNGRAILPVFTRVGVYRASEGVQPPYDRLAVNLLNASESDPQPADTLQVGAKAVRGKAQSKVVRREVWYWFAWAALGLLMIEWLVYTRRMHV